MLIRHLTRPTPRDLRVDANDPDATVADLAEALEPERPVGPLVIDGREVPAATPLDRAGIIDGAIVSRPEPGAAPLAPDPWLAPLRLVVTTGSDAGRALALEPGTWVLGRGLDGLTVADPTVSTSHVRLIVEPQGSVTIHDLGSTNGTLIDGVPAVGPTAVAPGQVVRCGAARWRIERSDGPRAVGRTGGAGTPDSGGGATGTRPWHRPPRPTAAPDLPLIEPPAEPAAPGNVTPIGMIAVVASVAAGGVMVLVLHSWTYAMFALLGPVLLVANSVDSRRRRRRARRRGRRRRRRDLDALRQELAARRTRDLDASRERHPGPATAAAVVATGRISLWERRPVHADAFAVRIGTGTVPWAAPLVGDRSAWAADVAAVADDLGAVADAPVVLDLDPRAPIAVIGAREAALGLVRSIVVQACAAHGPADLQVAVLCSPDRAAAWHWCAWLPHTHDPEVGSLLAANASDAETVAGRRDQATPPRRVVVIDHPDALAERRGPVRTVLRAAADPDAELVPIVLAPTAHDVPAACRIVLTAGADGTISGPPSVLIGSGALDGTADDVAADVARRLAHHDDPEVDDPGRGLPDQVTLTALLGVERISPAGLGARWHAAGLDPSPRATIGIGTDGPFVVDLAVDGPHALVAGTTGAGKSELLRTLVASLATSSSPDHLTFVLIDFKGGSAFDACARLPHTAGLVTDLDDHLAARALRCLEAELRHRERRLRAVGATDLAELRRTDPGGEPLPRLVVVVDEFATLAAELPDFVDALVGVAQRGRSLGVHLVLATQRPSGSVSEHIRANTALRIALRVQSTTDSADVIDSPAAAALPRLRPGRALVRLGPGELVPLQTALSTAPHRADRPRPVSVHRLQIPVEPRPGAPTASLVEAERSSELDALVDDVIDAWWLVGGRPPRRPWPDPLPADVAWPVVPDLPSPDHVDGTGASAHHDLVVGWADDPEHQRRTTFGWRLDDGPLLAVGLPGSGTTTLAATTALAAARRWAAARCHIHVLDMGSGGLLPLAGLPHVGAVIGADEDERQRRLYADLAEEVARRRADPSSAAAAPARLVLLDGVGAFRARWGDLDPSGTWDRFVEVTTTGAAVGIHTLLVAEGPAAAPHQVVSGCRQRVVFRLGERTDHGAFGIAASAVPPLPPGRAVAVPGPTVVQIARPPDGLASAVARLAGTPRPGDDSGEAPRSVQVLSAHLGWEELPPAHHVAEMCAADDGLRLAIGLSDHGLAVAHLVLPPGGHAVVAGPPRSGRTTALVTLAVAARATGVEVVAVTRRPEPWTSHGVRVHDPDHLHDADLELAGPLLVVVDDADLTHDDHEVLARVARDRRPDRHVIAAGRADRLRAAYGHWTREVRADRAGLLLVPDVDLDGDLLGVRLPRRPGITLGPGRGWLAGGAPEGFVQVAVVDAPADSTH